MFKEIGKTTIPTEVDDIIIDSLEKNGYDVVYLSGEEYMIIQKMEDDNIDKPANNDEHYILANDIGKCKIRATIIDNDIEIPVDGILEDITKGFNRYSTISFITDKDIKVF